METTQVVIVGAGPSGLCLALALARFHIHSVVLEKSTDITADPRGVYLTGDAVRILYDLDLGDELPYIGQYIHKANFHQSSFSTEPFYSLHIGTSNALQQAVPECLMQIQPRLEEVLRNKVQSSPWSKLLTGCTVTARSSDDPPTVEYTDSHNIVHRVQGEWLVGADGKVGIVRKRFLEPTASIKQEEGVYRYQGTWVAANLHLALPTADTHPDFPLWALGYDPEAVYDLFWPDGWHFCSPPGKATAAGRFGPRAERLWRHEFRHDADVDEKDAEQLFWEHITPMITLNRDPKTNCAFGATAVQYPRDCITILRCRPFRFTHKVVNRWYHKKTILIGDAAHVFPPFAGQGIASGLRDAHQLAWRLAILIKCSPTLPLLESWACERRKSVDDAALFSMLNGRLCNESPALWLRLLLRGKAWLENSASIANFLDPIVYKERRGFVDVDQGFFAPQYRGGLRLAQIFWQSSSVADPVLSDSVLRKSRTVFTLLAVGNEVSAAQEDAIRAIRGAELHDSILTEDSIITYNPNPATAAEKMDSIEVYAPSTPGTETVEYMRCGGYDAQAYVNCLGRRTRFAIIRPDWFVFACAQNYADLVHCLAILKRRLGLIDGDYS